MTENEKSIEEEIKRLEQLMSEPDFWTDKEKAKSIVNMVSLVEERIKIQEEKPEEKKKVAKKSGKK